MKLETLCIEFDTILHLTNQYILCEDEIPGYFIINSFIKKEAV